MYTKQRDDLREKPGPDDSRKTETLAAENRKGSRSLSEAVKVLAALVFAFTIAAVILLILGPEIGLPITAVFVMIVPAMIMAISVLALIFLVIYLYDTRLKEGYWGKLKEISANLEQPSSPFRVAVITGMSLIFLAMVNLFWTDARVVVNITGDLPQEIVPLLSPEFAGILPYINLLIILTILANLLYPVIKVRWVPMAIETVLGIVSAALLYIVLNVFPFNPALNSGTLLVIRMGLIFILVMTLIGAAKNLLKTITLLLQK